MPPAGARAEQPSRRARSRTERIACHSCSSLHQIGSNVVSCYLVEQRGQLTLIDTALPGQWRELQQELRRMGRSLEDIRALLLTHRDTDHIGFENMHPGLRPLAGRTAGPR
jgi:glyoxylase-like metal-dependent hydrolase (beta-lactamase superfamily II)